MIQKYEQIIKQYADSLKPYVSFKSSGKSSPYLSLKVRTKGTKPKHGTLYRTLYITSVVIHGRKQSFLTEEYENLTESQLINKLIKMSKDFSSKS